MKKFFLSCLIVISSFYLKAQSIAPFKAGERVVFIGNSITDGGHYHSYIWLYYMTHFPTEKMMMYNAGIGGDVAGQMYRRLDYDVFPHKPTVMTLTFGMNDSGYYDFYKKEADSIATARVAECLASYQKIESRFKQYPAIKKILIATSPYDETSKFTKDNIFPGKHKTMLKIVDFQEASAKKNGWGFVDFNRNMTAINLREQAKDSTFTLCGTDRIHPGNDGHLVMAEIFLKSQGLAGKEVADIAIDAASAKATKMGNCIITAVAKSNKGISFDYLANSLPYPIDTIPRGWNEKRKQSDALAVIPFMDEFNKEILTIKNLSAGQYQLKIDGDTIGVWSADDLSNGINLAEQTRTPQYQQATAIRELNEERWEIDRRFRQRNQVEFNLLYNKGLRMKDNLQALDTVLKYAPIDWTVASGKDAYIKGRYPEVRSAWEKEMQVLIDEIYSMNKPKKHKIELVAVDGSTASLMNNK